MKRGMPRRIKIRFQDQVVEEYEYDDSRDRQAEVGATIAVSIESRCRVNLA